MARHARRHELVLGALVLTIAAAIAFIARYLGSGPGLAEATVPIPSAAASGESRTGAESPDPSANDTLEIAADLDTTHRTESPPPAHASGGEPRPSRSPEEFLATRREQLQRLHSDFEPACKMQNGSDYLSGFMLLQTSIIAGMDSDGKFTESPNGFWTRGNSPDKLHLYSGGRHYEIDPNEHPAFAQLQSRRMESIDLPMEERLANRRVLFALSEDQRSQVAREYDLAMKKLAGSR